MKEALRIEMTKENINKFRFKTREEFGGEYGHFNFAMMGYLFGKKLKDFPPVTTRSNTYYIPRDTNEDDVWTIDHKMFVFLNQNVFETEE